MEDDETFGGEDMLDELRAIGKELNLGAPMFRTTELPEDNFDVRRHADLKAKVQVDLNDSKQLADLEDPGLQSHMEGARRVLEEYNRRLDGIPTMEKLQESDVGTRRDISFIITKSKELQMMLRVAFDEVFQQSTNAARISEGGSPHGFPAPGSANHASACFHTLSRKLAAASEEIEKSITALEEFESKLTIARRSYEFVVDGVVRRVRHHEGEAAITAEALKR
jgi:hypothetical protein